MSEQKPLSLEQLREEIAKKLCLADGQKWSEIRENQPRYRISYEFLILEVADQILAIVLTPEIVGEWIKAHPEAGYMKYNSPCGNY